MTEPTYRYLTIDGKLYRATEGNRKRCLETARDMKATEIELDLGRFRIVKLSDEPVEDWSNLSSAQAEALLAGLPPEAAEVASVAQEEAVTS